MSVETINIRLKEHSKKKNQNFSETRSRPWCDPENEETMPQQATAEAWSFS